MNLPKPMYEPVAFSPATALSAAIGSGDTSITVDDGAMLGTAPNIAVIGSSADEAETIVYGAKNGNILSGVQRGVQGTAKAWLVGDPVARNFTALDQSNIQDNIKALANNTYSFPYDYERVFENWAALKGHIVTRQTYKNVVVWQLC